jgi:rhodanese-related sulfurtransferase
LQRKDDLPNLIDVRSKEEWAAQTIPNSKNIPLAELNDRLAELDKSKKYIAFCAGTYRGLAGAARLRARGFDVLFLPGGVSVWDDKLPEANVESPRERGQEK